MHITILGSGCGVPHKDRGAPSYLIEADKTLLLMDIGSGTLQKLARLKISPHQFSHVLLSHAHIDHISDLLPLLFALAMPNTTYKGTLCLHTGPGFTYYMDGLTTLFGKWLLPNGGRLKVIEHHNESFKIDNLKVRTQKMRHHPTSVGFRVTSPEGTSLVYSGDTEACQELIDLSYHATAAIYDCSFPAELPCKGHMTSTEAAKVAQKANLGRLILSHRYPECDETDIIAQSCACYQGPVTLAEDGLIVNL